MTRRQRRNACARFDEFWCRAGSSASPWCPECSSQLECGRHCERSLIFWAIAIQYRCSHAQATRPSTRDEITVRGPARGRMTVRS